MTSSSYPALEMKIKKLMPMDAESRRLIDWMEKGFRLLIALTCFNPYPLVIMLYGFFN